jgi:hypothetical protein
VTGKSVEDGADDNDDLMDDIVDSIVDSIDEPMDEVVFLERESDDMGNLLHTLGWGRITNHQIATITNINMITPNIAPITMLVELGPSSLTTV